ncbi:MAG: hypothetical protein HOY79_34960 [Streptomyces sp.]|nr:hypothetical protein [Streptomyces sp.]
MREMRKSAREHLEGEGLDPERYNIDGIIRDAWINGNGSEVAWEAAVEKHHIRFRAGDWVRITVETEDGFTEHHYGPIENFRRPDGNFYRRNIAKPHAAFVRPEYTHSQVVPLADLAEEINDFEIVTEWDRVHEDGPKHNYGVYQCNGMHGPYPPPATVMVIHKLSGQKKRFCDDCNTPQQRAGLADEALHYQRNAKQMILELRADPTLITGPRTDLREMWEKTDADVYREWAEVFPWLVPAPAAELYKKWKEEQRASAAA